MSDAGKGKTINECWANYETYTGLASTVTRQLAFAGIAIIWIFKEGTSKDPRLPQALLLPAFGCALTLGLDFLQYVVASIRWRNFAEMKENVEKAGPSERFQVPYEVNRDAERLFNLKLFVIAITYLVLILYLLVNLFQ